VVDDRQECLKATHSCDSGEMLVERYRSKKQTRSFVRHGGDEMAVEAETDIGYLLVWLRISLGRHRHTCLNGDISVFEVESFVQ
jgi:hypothetical protein